MSYLKKANKAFKDKNFLLSLAIYTYIQNSYKSDFLTANISICKKFLANEVDLKSKVNNLIKTFNKKQPILEHSVCLFAKADNIYQIYYLENIINSQIYSNIQLIILTNNFIELDNKKILLLKTVFDCKKFYKANYFDFIGIISHKNYYDRNYILDLVLNSEITNDSTIGKGCYYQYFECEKNIKNKSLEYKTDCLIDYSSCILRYRYLEDDFGIA